MTTRYRLLTTAIVGTMCSVMIAFAQVPLKLHFQGILTTTSGITVADGNYQLTFRLYTTATAGTPVWTETQNVSVSSGIFSVVLGEVTPLNLSFDQPYYLGITVGSGSEMAPRIPLLGSPYSFYSRQAGNAAVGGDLAGSSTSATIVGIQGRSVSGVAPVTGQVLRWDGTQWSPEDVAGDNWGTQVVQVQSPLSGEGTSGNALRLEYDSQTLGINSSNELTVRSTAAIWNAGWLQGRSVTSAAPLVGQVLMWDGSQWAPGSVSSGGGSGWSTSGNVLSGTEFLGSINAQPPAASSSDRSMRSRW